MAGFSNSVENSLLNHFFGKSTYTAPTIFVGLSTADPGEAGATDTPPVGGSYARVETAAASWNTSTAGQTTNATAIAFPGATAAWGDVTYYTFYSAASAGTFLGAGPLSTAYTIGNGSAVQFAAGQLIFNLD